MEQHLTINDEGRVWFSGYNFGHNGERYEKACSKNFRIEKATTDRLLCAIAAYFGNEYDEIFATDIGNWEMELTNTEGTVYKFRGSLCADFDYEGIDLSDLVRDTVGMAVRFLTSTKLKAVERVFWMTLMQRICSRISRVIQMMWLKLHAKPRIIELP